MTFEEWCDKERLSCQYSYQLDALEDAWNAAIAFHACKLRPMVPEGYVLVPVEPTEKMEEAGLEVHPWDYTEDMQKIYKAMIQAAQEKE